MLIVTTNDAKRESVRIISIALHLHGVSVDSKRVVFLVHK